MRVTRDWAAAAAALKGATVSGGRGIQPGDGIAAVEGKPLAGAGRLLGWLDACSVGDADRLQVLGEGKLQNVVVVKQQPGV